MSDHLNNSFARVVASETGYFQGKPIEADTRGIIRSVINRAMQTGGKEKDIVLNPGAYNSAGGTLDDSHRPFLGQIQRMIEEERAKPSDVGVTPNFYAHTPEGVAKLNATVPGLVEAFDLSNQGGATYFFEPESRTIRGAVGTGYHQVVPFPGFPRPRPPGPTSGLLQTSTSTYSPPISALGKLLSNLNPFSSNRGDPAAPNVRSSPAPSRSNNLGGSASFGFDPSSRVISPNSNTGFRSAAVRKAKPRPSGFGSKNSIGGNSSSGNADGGSSRSSYGGGSSLGGSGGFDPSDRTIGPGGNN